MIQIKPIPMNFGKKPATSILMKVDFILNSDSSFVTYAIKNEDGEDVENGQLVIPSCMHHAWGNDDGLIEDYVLEQLNLERL